MRTIQTMFNKTNIFNLVNALAIVLAFITGFAFINYHGSHYTMNGIVIGVEKDIILIEDDTNNIWEFHGSNYEVDDVVEIKFYTNNTDNSRLDDEVESVSTLYHFTSNN